MNHNNEQLEQELLELHYGLLEDTEAQNLRTLIETDVEVAKAWAKTLEMAGQFANAAKLAGAADVANVGNRLRPPVVSQPGLDDSRMSDSQIVKSALASIPPLKKTNDHSTTLDRQNAQSQNQSSIAPARLERKPKTDKELAEQVKQRRRWCNRAMVAIASLAALVLVVLSSRYVSEMPTSPATAIRIDAESATGNGLARNSFEFVTSQMASRSADSLLGVSTTLLINIRVGNAIIHKDRVLTDRFGCASYSVPAGLKLPKDASLDVRTTTGWSLTVPLESTRCLTYLSADKPVYRPGETVRFRSLSLERYTLRPNIDLPIRFEMLDPSGATVNGATIDGVTDHGVGNGEFRIPSSAPGGEYTLVAKSLDGFFPDETRAIQVRNYRVPRFKKDLEFKRRSYGPGELVEADFEATRAEGGPLANQNVMITAKVDGEVVFEKGSITDASGTCAISFKLPEHISKGNGQLSVAIDDGGTQEVKSKTIPIQLGKVDVAFYPEGGYLVDGLANRVYFSARNPLGDPIHIAGEILDRSGNRVAKIETVRDGMGRFEFTPRAGELYLVKVTDPVDVTNSPTLPKVVKDLPVLSTGSGVFANDENIKFAIKSLRAQKIVIRAVCRGQLVADQDLELKPGTSSMEMELPIDVEGVIRLTVLNASVQPASPLVERLVYREPRRKLTVKIDEDASMLERTPGEPVRLSLAVFDENGQPAPAILGIAVVDDAALSLEEDEQPELPTHFLLTSEIEKPEDLEHANFYLSGSDESRESLDLLLGTQGWRRFVSSGVASATGELTTAGFSEQLARLIELDGKPASSVMLGNVNAVNKQWDRYSLTVSSNWKSLVGSLTWLVLPLIVILLIIYLMRPRLKLATHAGLMLLVACGYLAVLGCGAAPRGDASFRKSKQGEPAVVADDPAPKKLNDAMAFDDDEEEYEEEEFTGDADESRTPSNTANLADSNAGFGGRSKRGDKEKAWIVDHEPIHDGMFEEDDYEKIDRDKMEFFDPVRSIPESKLIELLRSRGIDPNSLGDQLLDELRFPVREYAHQHVSTKPNVREDFTETLYWQPLLITGSDGTATIRFDLSDSVTTFKVLVDAHSNEGRIGTGGGGVVSRLPLQIEPKMPLAVTAGDRIDLPVAVINATNADLSVGLTIKTDGAFELVGPSSHEWMLNNRERTRRHFGLKVLQGKNETDATIELTGTSSSLSDAIRKTIKVSPSGYPRRESVSGVMDEKVSVVLPIPTDAVPGSVAVTLKAYPSPLADLMAGVESILREPHGCFEQTSATNYPNTMALQYLQTNRLANPETTRRAKSLLDKGYQKLVSFECDKLGYEWFGSDPGHEALSAFGLLQFTDMARVMQVDVAMIARTRNWLMERRDGEGGFKRNPRHLHVWSVQQQIVDAYVLWALTESDLASGNPQRAATEMVKELNQLNTVARDSDDPYLIGLAAASMMNVNRTDEAEFLLDKLVKLQKETGQLVGKTTVTQSGGISKDVETTAIAVLAWTKNPAKYAEAYRSAAKWLVKNRQGNGGFGSTQATVLALKALVAYSKNASAVCAGSTLFVKRNNKVIGQVRLPEDAKNGSVVEITGLGSQLKPGETEIELCADGVKQLPFSVEVLYHTLTPPSDDRCPLELTTKFENTSGKDGQVDSGATLRVKVAMTNKTEQGQPMTVATIGLPGGVEPRVAQLNELQEAGIFDYYEIRPREVICYWRTIAPSETKNIEFDVTAEIAGKYTGPASRAYLYYTAEQKVWTEPLSIEIAK